MLKNLAEQWKENRSALLGSGNYSLEVLKKISETEHKECKIPNVPGEEVWKKCMLQLSRNYESDFGGFNTAPKFPQPVIFDFLFHMYYKNKKTEQGYKCLEMCLHTLKKMAYGGIHDHVNKGFAR